MDQASRKDPRRGRRHAHFANVMLRPRKDAGAHQVVETGNVSLGGMKLRVGGTRLPGRVFRVFLPEVLPPTVCGVAEVRWERPFAEGMEFGIAFRSTTDQYRDYIRHLRSEGSELAGH